MAIIINDNFSVNTGKPVDSKYLNIATPWTSIAQVNAAIPLSYRYLGLTVNINNLEYWYHTGLNNGDLVLKSLGGNAINGLHSVQSGTTISLGGLLTGNTVFDGNGSNYHLQYAGDYSGDFVNRSLVDKEYVDGIASGLQPKEAVLVATTGDVLLSGLTTIDGVLLTTGDRILVKNQINDIYNGIYSASTSTWSRTPDFDGSPVSEVITGSYAWVLSGNTNMNTAWVLTTPDPVVIGVSGLTFVLFSTVTDVLAGTGITVTQTTGAHYVSLNGVAVAGTCIDWNPLTCALDLSPAAVSAISGSLSGVTNGLSVTNKVVRLGGALTGNTTIETPFASKTALKIGTTGVNLYGGRVEVCRDNTSQSGNTVFIGARYDATNCSSLQAFSTSGVTIGTTIGGNSHSVRLGNNAMTYAANYCADFVNRSLVDKQYVDNKASGVTTFNSNLTVSIAAGKTFGRYVNGDIIPASGKTAQQVIAMSLVEPLNPTVTLSSSSSNLIFGLAAKTVNLTFSYIINSLGGTVSTAKLEWRRNNTGAWTTLMTSTVATTYAHAIDDSANRFLATDVNYRYTVVDSFGATGQTTYNLTPQQYLAPTISPTYTGSLQSYETVSPPLREIGNVSSTVGGSIASNRTLVNITAYNVQISVNGGAFSTIVSESSFSTQTKTISTYVDSSATPNTPTIAYRVIATDEYTTTTGSTYTINLRYASYFGYNTNAVLNSTQIVALGNQALLTSRVRTVNPVTATGGNYTYDAYPASFGDLTNVIQDGAAPVLGAFLKLSNVSVTNFYGQATSFIVYKSNATNAFNNNSLAFS